MKKVVALLPMKGVSERVPNKNLRNFNGKPLFHVVLNSLLKSKYIKSVVINTDSALLKENIKINFPERVKILDRNIDIRGNYVSMNTVINQDINTVDSEIYIQTHSTNPLLKTETMDNAIENMFSLLDNSSSNDSIFSVSKVQKRFYNKNAKPMNHDPKMLVTQHLEPIFEENSCFYIFTKESFIKNKGRIGVKPFMYEIDKIEAIDIDEPDDFIIAEALHKLLR